MKKEKKVLKKRLKKAIKKNQKNIEKNKEKSLLKKTWNFIWYEDSLLSWIVNVVLAFVIVKFVIYPGLGFVLSTEFPVVAVVSTSMHHDVNFERWWEAKKGEYSGWRVKKSDFESFKNGFDKGDIMVLIGRESKDLEVGDVIVYSTGDMKKNPIIHRIVEKSDDDGYSFQTKGDNNFGQLSFEKSITEEQIIGKAVLRVPYLGWVKIMFTESIEGVKNAVL